MRPLLFAAFLSTFAGAAVAQAPTYGCDSPESRQFDFWVGEWDLAFKGPDGKPGRSTNRITKILDGCVLLEQFTGKPGIGLDGHSVSAYDRQAGKWKQTWVDNTASYLDFVGGWADGKMILAREAEMRGKRFRQRMVWQDITPGGFKWLWQRSDDEGATWRTLWEIDYTRAR